MKFTPNKSFFPNKFASLYVFRHYDSNLNTVVSADACTNRLEAVLHQYHDNVLCPVAFASQILTPTEQRYSYKEKRKFDFDLS